MKRFVLFVVFLLAVGVVNAEFSQESASTWLEGNIVCSRAPIEEVAFATLALDSNDCLNQLKVNRIDPSGCFPRGNCNTKDTALAALVLKINNQPINNQLEYLGNSLNVASGFNENQWIIQIVANEAGTCSINYDGSGDNGYTVTFDENGRLPNGGSWIYFSSLPSFDFNEAVETISIDCSELPNVQKISIIKNNVNSFEIIEESDLNDAEFEIEYGCYGLNQDSTSCDTSTSFYASWILNEIGEDIATRNYLTSNANSDLYYSMLSKIDNSYLSALINGQEANDDSFNHNVKDTSFAVYSLKNSDYDEEMTNAVTWVESQQSENGMIGIGVLDTATALYLIYSNAVYDEGSDDGGLPPGCTDNFECDIGEECVAGECQIATAECNEDRLCTAAEFSLGICDLDCTGCGDGYCSPFENPTSCSIDCQETEQVCNNDGYCDFNENNLNCPFDCPSSGSGDEDEPQPICGDGICESGEDDFTCSQDCEVESSGSLWWLWLIIIILVLGGAAFFVLTKMKKGKSNEGGAPSYLQGPRTPPVSPQPQYRMPPGKAPRDQALESQLDESIKQAQELLKKKK